jgi:hypothetical protein
MMFFAILAILMVIASIEDRVQKELVEGKVGPYDTHPPLRERIAATRDRPPVSVSQDGRPASCLLDQPEATELGFIQALNPGVPAGSLRFVSWDEVGAQVTVPAWRAAVREYGAALTGLTAASIVDAIPRLPEIGEKMRDPAGMLLTPQQRTQRAAFVLAAALSLALLDGEWELHVVPGVFHLQKEAQQLKPFLIVQELMEGKLSREAWAARCSELGIGQLSLLVPSEIVNPT